MILRKSEGILEIWIAISELPESCQASQIIIMELYFTVTKDSTNMNPILKVPDLESGISGI